MSQRDKVVMACLALSLAGGGSVTRAQVSQPELAGQHHATLSTKPSPVLMTHAENGLETIGGESEAMRRQRLEEKLLQHQLQAQGRAHAPVQRPKPVAQPAQLQTKRDAYAQKQRDAATRRLARDERLRQASQSPKPLPAPAR